VHAKSDAEVIAIRPLLGSPNVTLLTSAEVLRLETSPSGREVTGVVVSRAGAQEVYAGDIVVVCAGAANTARILLRSASDQHPQGLANGSGQVGRNYMFHNSKAVMALSREPNPTVYQKTMGVNDFYLASGGREWPLGNIQMLGKSNAEAMKGEEPKLTKLAPKMALADVARHGVDFWLTTEDVPRPDNRVTVDRAGNVHLAYTQTNDSEAEGLYRELRKLLDHAGLSAHHVFDRSLFAAMNISLAGCAHQAGTCRFGADPATSVLDPDCKAHELDNLYVADASIMPSIGAVNPALTVMANALRVGDHLRQRLA
jgi:choline dehydrogenase-like flavoprotein